MTDYSAHDIHRLDQAYPDARRDVEDYIGNPAHKRRLAEVGPEVFAAELTHDLATYYSEMSIAGWAAIATVQLMDAGKTWEEDTDAAWAKVDELTAQLDKPCGSCHPCTNYRDETWRAANRKPPHVIEWDDAQAELKALRQVAEAAKTWRDLPGFPGPRAAALIAAVDALPNPADHLDICPGYDCPGCREATR